MFITMKKFIFLIAACAAMFAAVSCDKHDDLWNALDDLDNRVSAVEEQVAKAGSDLEALRSLVEALQENVTVDSVVETADGYTINFSDGTSAKISNGRDGSTPSISVAQDADGEWYWTVNGEFMLTSDGAKVRAAGRDGENGAAGVTPQIRINSESGEWEYSLDGGGSWVSTGVKARGEKGEAGSGESLFAKVEEGEDYVTFTLADGRELTLAKTTAFTFVIVRDGEGDEIFRYGERREFAVESKGVGDFLIFSYPKGWIVSFDGGKLTVSAPAKSESAELEGEVVLLVTSVSGASKIIRLRVAACDLRVLTFEDEDYKGSGGSAYWSSLIDSPQYGGPLIYGDYDYCDYEWADDGNTFLSSDIRELYDTRVFWNGGHVISNYSLTDLSLGSYTTQLSVYYRDEKTGFGGHNGSKNFCIHNGYADFFSYVKNLPELRFTDGEEHVVDHMWVMATTYTANSLLVGDGFSGGAAGADDWFCIQAQGYDSDDNPTADKPLEFYIFAGGRIITEWTKWDLSSLGKVSYVKFNCSGSKTGSYGLNTPAYFAYDDVAVRF